MATRSIQRSLSWWLAIQTLCCLAVISALIYMVAHHSFDQRQRAEIVRHEGMIHALYSLAKSADNWDVLRDELHDFFRTHDELAVQLRRNGELIFAAGPAASTRSWRQERLVPRADAPELELQLGVDVGSDRAILRTLAFALVIVSLGTSLVASLIGARLVRKALTPLRSLALETRRVGPHSSGKRLDEGAYGTEMAPLCTSSTRCSKEPSGPTSNWRRSTRTSPMNCARRWPT